MNLASSLSRGSATIAAPAHQAAAAPEVPAWVDWLRAYSSPAEAPHPMGAQENGYPALADAPGSYVLEP